MKKYLLSFLLLSTTLFANEMSEFLSLDLQGARVSTKDLYTKPYYEVHKGYNRLITPKDGVDIFATFTKDVLVFSYDNRSQKWALYTPDSDKLKKLLADGALLLKTIEPYHTFYLKSSKNLHFPIVSNLAMGVCAKLMQNPNFETITDSGKDNTFTYNKNRSIALKSRYFTHTRKGIYDDSRVMIIIPKVKLTHSAKPRKIYAPAIPKMMIHYDKSYDEKLFFAYDFLNRKCNSGRFPSPKYPPTPTMKEVK